MISFLLKEEFKKKICLLTLVITLGGCKERFEPDIQMYETGFLVVEGYINIGTKVITTLTLSRTTPVNQSKVKVSETNALVTIENSTGESFQLLQTEPGVYISDSLTLSLSETYRINISIAGKIYLSDFVTPIETPDIDSVYWQLQANNDVLISISTHDYTGEVQLYQWEYDEVWEIKSPFLSLYDYTGGTTFMNRTAEEIRNMQTCWKYKENYGFNTFSTKDLEQNAVLNRPVLNIPNNSERLSVRYSIEVRQHALSNEGYAYIQLILKNSESLGTFFDPLPGQLTGNIYCTSTSEPVVGLIGAYSTKTKRIEITSAEVPTSNYSLGCLDTLIMYDSESLSTLMRYNLALKFHFSEPLVRDGVYIIPNYCADCRTLGGTNIKPAHWDEP